MNHVTLVMPFYMNRRMLEYQYNVWRTYSEEVKSNMDIVIVDDGSPEQENATDLPIYSGVPDISFYRIQVDIPWNQHGARNLGAHVAQGPWLLMTDMDHVVPEATLRSIMRKNPNGDGGRKVYTFGRIEAISGERTLDRQGNLKPHVNSFAITREAYWIVGGYDEDYCGGYGTDGLFRRRMYDLLQRVHLDKDVLIRFGREHIPDASTRTLERRPTGSVKGRTKEIRNRKRMEGRSDEILTLNFPWKLEKRVWAINGR